jgi:hypothetical protein
VVAAEMIDPEQARWWLWCLWVVEFNIVYWILFGYFLQYMPSIF